MMQIASPLNNTQRIGQCHYLICSAEAIQVIGPVEYRDSMRGPQQPCAGIDAHFTRPRPETASSSIEARCHDSRSLLVSAAPEAGLFLVEFFQILLNRLDLCLQIGHEVALLLHHVGRSAFDEIG